MPIRKYENAITCLYEVVPDVRTYFEKRSKELCGEGNEHVVYGSVLVEYINSLVDGVGGENGPHCESRLKELFRFVEELSMSEDFETICLIETGFIEGLLCRKNGLERFAIYMKPTTRMLAKRVAKRWGLNTELL